MEITTIDLSRLYIGGFWGRSCIVWSQMDPYASHIAVHNNKHVQDTLSLILMSQTLDNENSGSSM